ncbi:hypothetical protein J6TS2_39780 [Heyndrickxia sporothermodurans]|nr:hypothetical protein J6TS2_39780 [Heyndrickxia sporothermodurans]
MLTIKPIFFIIAGIIFSIVQILLIVKRKKFNILELLTKFIFLNYCLFTIFILFFPIIIDPRAIEITPVPYNLIPFSSIIETTKFTLKHGYYIALIENIVGNFLILLPLSFYLKVIWNKLKTIKKTIIIAILIPVLIESLQLILDLSFGSARSVDIDDVILNASGFLFGYWLAIKLSPTIKEMLSNSNINFKKNKFSQVQKYNYHDD